MRIFRLAVLGHHRYEMKKKKKRFSGACKVLYDDRQWNGVCSNENLSVSYPFNGDIFLFSCNSYLLLQSHNLFVMRLNKESKNKRENESEYFPGANSSIAMSYNEFKWKPLTGQINCLGTSLRSSRPYHHSGSWLNTWEDRRFFFVFKIRTKNRSRHPFLKHFTDRTSTCGNRRIDTGVKISGRNHP